MSKPFFEIGNFHWRPFEVENFDDYKFPEKFPECCVYHTHLIAKLNEWFEKFPDCCERHKKLHAQFWFDKNNYKELPLKIVKQLTMTTNHLSLKSKDPDWLIDFKDYLECNILSFGTPSIGEDRYIHALKVYLSESSNKELSAEIRNKALAHIEHLFAIGSNESSHEPTSLNALYEVYQRWLKIFPFGLSYFKDLEPKLKGKLMFIQGETHYNPYVGLRSAKIHTPSSLLSELTNLTKTILSKIDSVALLQSGTISDYEKLRLDLINESHRVKQVKLLTDYDSGELKYLEILEQWLLNEKNYFWEILPMLSGKPQTPSGIESEKLKKYSLLENQFRKNIPMGFAIEHFLVFTQKKSKNGRPYLSDQQFEEFIERAFLKNESAKRVKVNLTTKEKGFFIKRFYQFYEAGAARYGDKNQKQDYISIVADCFDNGWTRQSIDAFFKPNKSKESW